MRNKTLDKWTHIHTYNVFSYNTLAKVLREEGKTNIMF